MSERESAFRNNDRLKKVGTKIEWTTHMLEEYKKCKNSYLYFIENYYKIETPDGDLIPCGLYEYQKELLELIHNNRWSSACMARQMGKTTAVAAYICWYMIFNEGKKVGIISKDKGGSVDILERVQVGYEYLPLWLQSGIVKWNAGSFVLENRSRIIAAATTSSSIRGKSLSFCYIDEVAFIDPNKWDAFYKSTYPVISAGKESKIAMTSTPDGMNHFYYIHTDAEKSVEEGGSRFVGLSVPWHKHPERDEKWKQETIDNFGKEAFKQEYDIEFIGSSKTLLNPNALRLLKATAPIIDMPSMKIIKNPIEGHIYLTTVDVSRGLKQDYSTFSIIDITNPMKHDQVAVYRNNEISHLALPEIVVDYSQQYNESHILCELNDLGETVADLIYNELEYENIAVIKQKGKRARYGMTVTAKTKSRGCQTLKYMIENNVLKINESQTIRELNSFIEKGPSFQAETGCHDDLVMPLVNYAWYIETPYFQNNFDQNILNALDEANKSAILADEMTLPVIIIDGKSKHKSPFDDMTKEELKAFRF